MSAGGIEGNAGRQKESEGGICILQLYKTHVETEYITSLLIVGEHLQSLPLEL